MTTPRVPLGDRAPAFGPIHAPVDGTPEGERALPLAAALAGRLGARLVLVHAIAAPPPLTVDEITVVSGSDDAALRAAGAAYLERLAARVRRERGPGADAVDTALLDGEPARAVAEHARGAGAGLLVMPTHAHGAVARALLGSVALDVVRHAGLPVVLVPPRATPPADADPLPRHVVLPHDGSLFAERVVNVVAPLAAALDARCTVLGFVEPMLAAASLLPAEDSGGELAARLDHAVARLRAAGADADAVTVPHGKPAHAAADYAAEHGADLIALTTHARHGIGRLVTGSVADAVVHEARCPVLLWHPGE